MLRALYFAWMAMGYGFVLLVFVFVFGLVPYAAWRFYRKWTGRL